MKNIEEFKKVRGVFEKELGSGVWWVQYFDAEGKRHREKVGSKRAAIKLVELRRTQRLEGRKLPKPRTRPLLLRELTDSALAYTSGQPGYRTNVSRMKHLIAEFGDCVAEEITPERIKARLDSATDRRCRAKDGEAFTPKKLSVATKNRYIALLKLTFRLAEESRKIAFNPARLMHQKKENNARIRWLRDKEEGALREVIQRDYPEHMPEFEIALHTGMRRSEQYRMEWERVDFENGLIEVPQSKHGEKRYVRMNSRVRMILTTLKDQSTGTGCVFSALTPRFWFEPAVAAAGVKDFTWHCLRHTFISRLVMAGVDLRTVQELAGHKTIAMTCRYAHLSPQHQQSAIEKLVPLVSEEETATSSATEEFEGLNSEPATVH